MLRPRLRLGPEAFPRRGSGFRASVLSSSQRSMRSSIARSEGFGGVEPSCRLHQVDGPCAPANWHDDGDGRPGRPLGRSSGRRRPRSNPQADPHPRPVGSPLSALDTVSQKDAVRGPAELSSFAGSTGDPLPARGSGTPSRAQVRQRRDFRDWNPLFERIVSSDRETGYRVGLELIDEFLELVKLRGLRTT